MALLLLTLPARPGPVHAGWLGLEIDGRTTGSYLPWELAGAEGYLGQYELTARFMYQEHIRAADLELHVLTGLRAVSDASLPVPDRVDSPFRSLDLEAEFLEGENPSGFSEVDRLWLSVPVGEAGVILGRQAITWGDAYFFNIGDVFGSFPVTETIRLFKPGIDAVTLTLPTGSFTALEIAHVPGDDGTGDSTAGNLLLQTARGTVTLTGGHVAGEALLGVGYTTDVKGTRLYVAWQHSDAGVTDLVQAVAGAERQLGEWTHFLAELYVNEAGTDDPDEYPLLLADNRYRTGRVFSLGRLAAAAQLSRQLTPLVTGRGALFANLSDGSALLRFDGTYSASDLTDLWGGLSLGFGRRPEPLVLASEYGQVPVSVYLEVVHNLD